MTEVVEDLDSSYLEEQNGYSNESEGEFNEGSEVTENNSPEKTQTPKSKKKTKRVTKRKKAEATTDDENEGENGEEAGSSAKKKKKKKPAKKTFERRKIKSLLTTDQLEESTKNALAQEQERLQRLQQAQRDAFANEVLKDFDLKQLTGLTGKINDELFETPNGDPDQIKSLSQIQEPFVLPKQDEKKGDLIDLSSDEGKKKRAEKKEDAPGSDSSDIQILSDVELDEDDPDNSGMHTNDRLNVRTREGKVIVNISEKNPNQVLYVADSIESVIKPHQIGGVRFLYDNIIESPSVYQSSPGFGCILGHAMGLGKTLQIVTFSDIFLRTTTGRHVLIIVPVNTIANWASEFRQWLPHNPFPVHLVSDNLKTISQRGTVITSWRDEGGVLLMGYELFRLLAGTKAQQRKKKISKARKKPVCVDIEEEDREKDIMIDCRKILVDPGADLVICDEGHRIKNSHASISQVLKAIKTRRRVVLTGYPLQNNLMEYWCMVDFVRPNYLGNKTEFSNMFERPIQNGQCVDSTPRDVKLMMFRAHVLHSQLNGFVQRRSHRVLRQNLPPKFEHVLLVSMSPLQRRLYATFTEDLLGQRSMANPLKAFAVCCKIWNHPDVLCKFLRQKEATEEFDLDLEDLAATKKGGKKKPQRKPIKPSGDTAKGLDGVPKNGNGYDMQQQQYLQSPPQQNQFQSQMYQQQQPGQPPFHFQQQLYQQPQQMGFNQGGFDQYGPGGSLQRLQHQVNQQPQTIPPYVNGSSPSKLIHDGPGFDPFQRDIPEKKDEISYDWANGMFSDYVMGLVEHSNKMLLFFKILEETIKVGERVLLFSQSLLTLDLMETFLHERTVPTTNDEVKWVNGRTYFRLDGSTPAQERDRLVNAFNKAPAIQIPLFLISTRAGSLGINLVGANRVVIFDASWNPCHDAQAVCRVYRYGQIKPCYIYRLVSDKCLEKKIYDRQVNKQGMSDRVVDESNPDNYLSTKDVHSLWAEEDLLKEIPIAPWDIQGCVQKCNKLGDVVLANVVEEIGATSLSQYPFTHESLLVDRKEKKLSRMEKKIAERSFEAERHSQISYTRPSYAAYYPKGPEPPGGPLEGPIYPHGAPLGLPNLPGFPGLPGLTPAPDFRNQNNIGPRKSGSYKPATSRPLNEHESLSFVKPKSQPVYNGMRESDGVPATSQALQANPPGSPSGSGSGSGSTQRAGGGNRFPIEALARREGVKLQEVYVPKNIVIPTKNQAPIALKAGQRVMLIKTPKGVYLRLRDQIVKIRLPNGLMPFGPVPEAAGSTSGSGISSLGTGSNSGSPKNPGNGSVPASPQQNPPDVVTLGSDEDE